MKHLLVLGGGSAGTMVVAKLRPRLAPEAWRITVVDRDDDHHYRPGYLFVPFGTYGRADVVRPRQRLLPDGVAFVEAEVAAIDPEASTVALADGRSLTYDQLVIATGSRPQPDATPGVLGSQWRESVHEFYTLEGAEALRGAIDAFEGGRFVVHVTEMPISCPVAPLEMAFLADARFRERGIRERVDLVYVSPLDGAFTRPVAAERLSHLLAERGIAIEADFVVERVDPEAKTLVSFDGRTVPFDLLVTTSLNRGAAFLTGSGLADELDHVEVDPGTLRSLRYPNVFALGDAADLPTSKAGATAHYAADVFVENFAAHVEGRPLPRAFDGHANCFVVTGPDRAVLLDFDYEHEPLPGHYPVPGIGPFTLLEESAMNFDGKMLFRWAYWNVLLRGIDLPFPTRYTTAGKRTDQSTSARAEVAR